MPLSLQTRGKKHSHISTATFHHALPGYLCDDLERIQKRALSIISPGLSYTDNLTVHDISTLKDRRQKLCKKLFQTVVSDADHKLYHLLPPSKTSAYNLRRLRRFDCPATRTNRFSNSYHGQKSRTFSFLRFHVTTSIHVTIAAQCPMFIIRRAEYFQYSMLNI